MAALRIYRLCTFNCVCAYWEAAPGAVSGAVSGRGSMEIYTTGTFARSRGLVV